MLLEGSAVLEIDGERHALKPQDTTFIPAGLPHRFVNGETIARLFRSDMIHVCS